jgi:glycosyltransferase involved in cell wall biosynthesis
MDNDCPFVDLILITYDREREITRTIEALERNLIYPRDRLRYLIADDYSPGGYKERLKHNEVIRGLEHVEFVPAASNLGWGGNANRALSWSDAPFVFQIEDDYVLTKRLDLLAAVATMVIKPEIGMLRFRGVAGDHVILHLMEADISPIIPGYCEGVGLPGKLTYMLLDSGSPALYLYSHGAHLKRANFHAFYGYYPEGLKLGATEESYAHIVKDKMRSDPFSPVIAIQPDWIAMHFDHIGVSYQHSALDLERRGE